MTPYGSVDWKVNVGRVYLAAVTDIIYVGSSYNLLSKLRYFRDLRQLCSQWGVCVCLGLS